MQPESGMYADVTPFATVIRSGSIPSSSLPNETPVRPNPHTTSSAIRRTS